MTTAPTPSGRLEKQSWIAMMMPSFSALRLAGRLRPTVSTAPVCTILSRSDRPAAAVEAFPMGVYYFLCRIVIFYNDFGRSQGGCPGFCPRNGVEGIAANDAVIPAQAGVPDPGGFSGHPCRLLETRAPPLAGV